MLELLVLLVSLSIKILLSYMHGNYSALRIRSRFPRN